MPWFKVDDNLAFHAKTVAAGNAAMGLWVRAGAWCSQNLTDGFVPDHMLTQLGTEAQTRRLVDNRLWDEVSGGFRFHEWNQRQPQREEVEAEREAARERMRVFRAKKKGTNPENTQVSGGGSPEVPHVVFGNPDPTRPDPTRPDPPKKAVSRKRATQLPTDWHPNDNHAALARERGLNPADELAKFRDHAAATGRSMKDWDAAFRNWLRNAKSFGGRHVSDAPTPIPPRFIPPTPPGARPDSAGKARDALRQAKDGAA